MTNAILTNMGVLVLRGLSQTIKSSFVSLMIPMREIETSNTHTSIDKSLELRNFPACWSQSTDHFIQAVHIDMVGCKIREEY